MDDPGYEISFNYGTTWQEIVAFLNDRPLCRFTIEKDEVAGDFVLVCEPINDPAIGEPWPWPEHHEVVPRYIYGVVKPEEGSP